MYNYRYINECSQFGRTTCTLILDDLEGEMPSVRMDLEFGVPSNQLDDETLYQAAAIQIQAAVAAYDIWYAEQEQIAADAASQAQSDADALAAAIDADENGD
jgi:hypothetical protein